MTSQRCAIMYFAGKYFANAFRINFDVEATSFYTEFGFFQQLEVRTHVTCLQGMCENENLQYS